MLRVALALAIAFPVSLVGLFAAAAIAGSLVMTGSAMEGPRRVYLFATPIHADIVVPIADDVADWRPLIRSAAFPGDAAHRAALADAAGWVAIGWGAQSFYFNVHRLSDARPRHVLDAIWDDGAMHVTALGNVQTIAGRLPVDLSEAGYRRLTAALEGAFERGADGEAIAIPGQSYFDNDGFFEAVPDYSVLRSCNVWAADLLRQAGVRVPLWSPFSKGLVRALRD